jgi:hypothetical protein
MKVKLINVAEYDLKDGKSSEMPFNTFVNLCGGINTGLSDNLPKVRLFKTMAEFISLSNEEVEEIDKEEAVRVLSNGQFLVFLKGNKGNKEEKTKSVKDNATTDTKEDTTK